MDGVDESCAITAWGGTDPVKLPSGEEYRALCKRMNAAGELPENVTIVRLHRTFYPGERSVNATQINGIDPLDPVALGKAEVELRGQIDQCVAFLRNHVPGFGKCRVKSSAGTLGVRETRRVMGDAMVVDDDLLAGRHYPDAVVHNAWFLIDIHNPKGGGQAEGHSHPAQPYDIRYGAFLPKGIDSLLTAGAWRWAKPWAWRPRSRRSAASRRATCRRRTSAPNCPAAASGWRVDEQLGSESEA